MSFTNERTKEINCKIVYYGPPLGGKSTSLRAIYEQVNSGKKGELVSLSTEDDRTLFFDFVPLNLGTVSGYTLRLHLYTIPGQAAYDAQRKLITLGADGIVFVADSQIPRMDANLASFRELQAIFADEGVEWGEIPFILQLNKRDAKQAAPADELGRIFAVDATDCFATVATRNEGVFEALRAIGSKVLHALQARDA